MQSAARVVALALLTVLAGCEVMSNPAQQSPDTPSRNAAQTVPGQYIVVFTDNVADPARVAQDLVNGLGGSSLRVYTSAIKGFAARLSAAGRLRTNKEPWARSGPRLVVAFVRAALPPAGYLEEGTDLPPSTTPKGEVERR